MRLIADDDHFIMVPMWDQRDFAGEGDDARSIDRRWAFLSSALASRTPNAAREAAWAASIDRDQHCDVIAPGNVWRNILDTILAVDVVDRPRFLL